MKRIKKLDEGILYRNPDPGIRAEAAFLPNVLPISETEVLCFYRIGSAFYAPDGRLAKLRSQDGGRTWNQEAPVWDPKFDNKPYNYTSPHATRLRDGRMILIAERWDSDDPDLPVFNPVTGGVRTAESVIFRSFDDGHTWQEPQVMDTPGEGLSVPPVPDN